MNGVVMLAADGDLDFLKYWTKPGSPVGELALVFGFALLVAFVAFSWAAFWRKPRRRRHAFHHNQPAAADRSQAGLPRRRRRRRPTLLRILRRQQRRHRRHRRRKHPANPTLADIGGLPPVRHQPPPAS